MYKMKDVIDFFLNRTFLNFQCHYRGENILGNFQTACRVIANSAKISGFIMVIFKGVCSSVFGRGYIVYSSKNASPNLILCSTETCLININMPSCKYVNKDYIQE